MGIKSRPKTSRDKLRAHRRRLLKQGLRPIQYGVPHLGSPVFVAEAQAVARGCQESERPAGSGLYRSNLRCGRNVKRGEIWTVAGGLVYSGKPRPVVIL